MALLLVLFVPEKNIRWFLGQNLHYISSFFFILKGVSGPKRNPPARPIRSTTQIWIGTRHQYRISALAPQTSSGGETYGSVAKCRLFSQAFWSLLFIKKFYGWCLNTRVLNMPEKKNRSLNQIRLSNVLAVNWVKKFYLVLRLFL